MSFFKRFFGSNKDNDPIAWSLYETAVEQARAPVFYRDLGVPDTQDGRFEMISLHVVLMLRRMKRAAGENTELAQNVFDAMFSDMDRCLRELGSGDLGVAPRVKKMGRAFYGRIAAYEAALDPGREPGTLRAAIRRNIYGTVDSPDPASIAALRDYMLHVAARLDEQSMAEMAKGRVTFGAPPEGPVREDPGVDPRAIDGSAA